MATAERTDALQALTRRARRALDEVGVSLVGRRVLALCSGGADSVALVAALGSLPRGAAPAAIDVLFLDHALRVDVAAERAAARAAAESIGATLHERRAEHDLAAGSGGLEAAARAWRYEAAEELARALGAEVVATGHTADDQLESVLLALVGVTGRGGRAHAMPLARELAAGIQLLRPLLSCTRGEVEDACGDAGLGWGRDPTNDDPDAHVRNAVRHRVVPPLLELHPGAGSALLRAAERERDQAEAGRALADALLDAWLEEGRLDVRRMARLPAPARRELVACWLDRAGIGRGLTTRTIAAVDALAVLPGRSACSSIDLPRGACVRRDGYHLHIQHDPRHGGPRP